MQPLTPSIDLLERCDYEPIGDYALIGDCRCGALVSRSGSIDWLCLPDFSSPSLFAALLDKDNGGRLLVAPRAVERISRRYLGRSAVLETTFHCAGGSVVVTDFMPMAAQRGSRTLIRRLECGEGSVDIDVVFQPRPVYATAPVALERSAESWQMALPESDSKVALNTPLPLELAADGACLRGAVQLQRGETVALTLVHAEAGAQPPQVAVEAALDATLHWWEQWCRRCRYDGLYADQVMRSCITLKLLTHQETGAVMAAITTSLPESLSAGRNWDYRFCWLRDTSLLLRSFLDMGFREESAAFLRWLLEVGRKPRLQPLYDLHGRAVDDEVELSQLEGWRGHGPVRVGNSANHQLQLDIYGELIQTAYVYVCDGGDLGESEKRLLASLGDAVQRYWRKPDQGIWETRGAERQHTYSKVMCWVALDSLLKINARVPLGLAVYAVTQERDALRIAIERCGYNEELGAYVGYFGGAEADASLLLMARYGYLEADDPRMRRTYQLICDQLSNKGLLYRYPQSTGYDGLEGEENLFVVCNFWAVDYLARSGAVDAAVALFERLLALANDVGLYAEQFDVDNGTALGNFPQAFSHSGLINAAIAIEQARVGKHGAALAS